MRPVYRHFDSLVEYCALEPNPVNRSKWSPERWGDQSHWYGVPTYEEAVRICKAGVWPDGLRRMEQELSGFEAMPAKSIRRRAIWSDQGDALDIHRIYTGQIERAWRRPVRRTIRSSQNLTIVVPLTTFGRDRADAFFWRGAAALKLADVLTVAGYSVMIIGVDATESQSGQHIGYDSLIIKDYSSPMDVNALLVATAFPGFSRTVTFNMICSHQFEVAYGLGTAMGDVMEPLAARNIPEQGVIRGLFDKVRDGPTARRWVSAWVQALAAYNEAA